MVDADPDEAPRPVSDEDLAKADLEGLCDERSVDIYLMWHSFGGLSRGLSVTEIVSMPAWLRKDFVYLSKTMGRLRRESKAMEKLTNEGKARTHAAKQNTAYNPKFAPSAAARRFRRR